IASIKGAYEGSKKVLAWAKEDGRNDDIKGQWQDVSDISPRLFQRCLSELQVSSSTRGAESDATKYLNNVLEAFKINGLEEGLIKEAGTIKNSLVEEGLYDGNKNAFQKIIEGITKEIKSTKFVSQVVILNNILIAFGFPNAVYSQIEHLMSEALKNVKNLRLLSLMS
ncbi:MAG: hypothetical protein HRU36_03915, partial [Rickettsiales bacterium]|nr:hypothetical protein [Rickettsiales bacterium]